MAVPNIHVEEYEVTTEPQELSSPTRLWFQVKKRNVSGDNPVEEMFLQRYLSGDTRKGREDLEDATALVKLLDTSSCADYPDAKDDIHIGCIVSYLSKRVSGTEQISEFTWS